MQVGDILTWQLNRAPMADGRKVRADVEIKITKVFSHRVEYEILRVLNATDYGWSNGFPSTGGFAI